MDLEDKKQEQDIKTLEAEFNSLKTAYTDLESKYKELEKEHNDYKFNIEFEKDTQNLKNIDDKELSILKNLKQNGDLDAYNLLRSNYFEKHRYTDIDGNKYNYVPQDGNSNINTTYGNLFEQELK